MKHILFLSSNIGPVTEPNVIFIVRPTAANVQMFSSNVLRLKGQEVVVFASYQE